MNQEQIKALLHEVLPGCHVSVDIDGSHFNLVVVSDQFEGVRAVKRQQMIYGALGSQIADGTIHAVNMRTYTPDEWETS